MQKISRVLFIGSKSIGLECLKLIHSLDSSSLVGAITIDDRGDKRSRYNDFVSYCVENDMSLQVVQNRREFEVKIQSYRPDLCIVVGWYWLVSKKLLEEVTFIGVHHSLLPKYRGGSPLVWSIINGEKEVGTTLFSFTEGMDDGDIWGQCIVKLDQNDYVSDVLDKLEREAIGMLSGCYRPILDGKMSPCEQDHESATYCAQRFPNDGLIDWNKSALGVYNFIRAQSPPYPGAFTFKELGGESARRREKIMILRAHLEDVVYYGTPGQVAKITDQGVYVVCGNSRPIVLERVSYEGEKPLDANMVVTNWRTRF